MKRTETIGNRVCPRCSSLLACLTIENDEAIVTNCVFCGYYERYEIEKDEDKDG